MWKRFTNWLRSFTPSEERYDIYHPRERLIFHYYNGHRMVTADPLVLYKKIMDVAPDLSIDMQVSKSISKDAGAAHVKLVKRIREIFNLNPLVNGFEIPQGENATLTDTECQRLLDQFLVFVGWVKKNSRNTETTVMGTSPSTVKPTEGEENLVISNIAGSGSTDAAPSSVEPIPSPKEHPLPSGEIQASSISMPSPMARGKPLPSRPNTTEPALPQGND